MQLDTQTLPAQKAWSSNATLSTTVTAYVDSTATPPSTSSSAALYVVPGSPPNGIGVQVWHSSSGGGSTLRVIGWRRVDGTTLGGQVHYAPHLIAQYTVTSDTTAGTTAGIMGALYPAITHSKNYGDGKSYDSVAAQKCPGWVMVDTVGYEFVGISLNAATGTPTANMLVACW